MFPGQLNCIGMQALSIPRMLSTSDLGERLQHVSSRNTALQESNAQLVAKLEEEQVSYMYHLPLTPLERSVNQS